MLKQILSLIILGTVLFVFYSEFLETPFVNIDELTATREKAVSLANQGEYQESISIFNALLEVAPENKQVWGDYLIVLMRSGQEDQAYQLAKQQSIELIPGYALKEIFELAISRNDIEFAQQLAHQEIKVANKPHLVAIQHAHSLLELGHPLDARGLVDYARQVSSEDSIDLDNAEIIILNETDVFLAQEKIALLLSKNESVSNDLWDIYIGYWINEARQGNAASALEALRPYLEKAPDSANLKADYLVLLTWDNQFDQAIALYDSDLSKQKQQAYVDTAVAQAMYKQGRLEEAEDLYQQLLKQDLDNFEHKKGLAKVYVELGQGADALFILQPASALVDHDARVIIGLAQQQLGRNEEALASLSTALNSKQIDDAATYEVWMQSFKSVLPNKSFDQLWPRYSIPLNAAPANVRDYVDSVILQKKHLVSVNSKPKFTRTPLESMRLKAALARQQNQSEKAVLWYNEALAISPNDKDLRLGLALTLIDLGDEQKSRRILAELYNHYPGDRRILDAYVYYAQQFDRNDVLVESLRQLAEISEGIEKEHYIQSWLTAISNSNNLASVNQKLIEILRFSQQDHPNIMTAKARLRYMGDRCDKAKSIIDQIDVNTLSSNQLESIALISRDCGYRELASNYYNVGMTRYPNQSVFFAGGILSAIDLGDMPEADRIAACCEQRFIDGVDFNIAKAYLRFKQKDYQNALDLYLQVLVSEPNNDEAHVGSIMSRAELGMAEQAFSDAQTYQARLSDTHWKRLYELRIRQSLMRTEKANEADRYVLAYGATEIIDEYIAYLERNDPDAVIAKRDALLNKVHSQTLAGMPSEAISTFESLEMEKDDLPLWGVLNVADAYAQNRQPEAAVQLLSYANEVKSDDLKILSALFFAQLDLEDYKSANKTMSQMNALVEDEGVVDGRVHWVKRLDAMFQAYQNRLQEAEDRLLTLKQKAPNDIELLKNLATVYRWRGLVDKANDSLNLIDQKNHNDNAVDVTRTHLLIDSQRYAAADEKLQKLNQYSYNNDVKNLSTRWEIHNKRQYTASTQYGESSGNALGNKDFTFEQRLYTAPIQNQYRLYVRDRYDWAEFPEDNGNLHRIGIGGEYRSDRYDVIAEVNTSVRGNTNAGITLAGVWRFDDHLSTFGELQTYSRNVPLRAINADIDGESVSAGIQYRRNESQKIRTAISYTDFSDGNKRTSLYLEHEHSVYQSAHHQVFLSEEIYASDNTEDDVGYFNPDKDLSLRVAAKYRGVIWRHYDKSLKHQFNIGVGTYKQKNESNAGIWDVEYRQQWTPEQNIEVDYGLLHRRRTYDGEAESYNAISASINWRF